MKNYELDILLSSDTYIFNIKSFSYIHLGVLTIEYTVAQSSILTTGSGPENAVDNIDNTCAWTEYGAGNYWRILFNETLTVKRVELRLKGGACLKLNKMLEIFYL